MMYVRMPSFAIRYANAADAQTIADYNAAMALETEGLRLDRERLQLGVQALFADSSKGFYLVAEQDGSVIGQMMITYEWSDWRNGVFWWIQSVYVHPDHRRAGVFRSLYLHAESLSRSQPDVCGLRLYVERNNAKAQQTYAGLGMQKTPYEIYELDYVLTHEGQETNA